MLQRIDKSRTNLAEFFDKVPEAFGPEGKSPPGTDSRRRLKDRGSPARRPATTAPGRRPAIRKAALAFCVRTRRGVASICGGPFRARRTRVWRRHPRPGLQSRLDCSLPPRQTRRAPRRPAGGAGKSGHRGGLMQHRLLEEKRKALGRAVQHGEPRQVRGTGRVRRVSAESSQANGRPVDSPRQAMGAATVPTRPGHGLSCRQQDATSAEAGRWRRSRRPDAHGRRMP